jgi:hypothetical protein
VARPTATTTARPWGRCLRPRRSGCAWQPFRGPSALQAVQP